MDKGRRKIYLEKNRNRINLRQRINYRKRITINPNMLKTNKCIDCGLSINVGSVRCIKCKGKSMRIYERPHEIGDFVRNCKCGCGKYIVFQRHHIYSGIPNYISGHRPSPRKGKRSERKGKTYDQIYPDKKEQVIEKIKKARVNQILPVKDTSIEVKIQNFLKQLGIEFFTHQYMREIEHSYQCDIFIPSMNLVIECDGDYWHKYPIGLEKDHIRTSELLQKGFKVLRLWEYEINKMGLVEFESRLESCN